MATAQRGNGAPPAQSAQQRAQKTEDASALLAQMVESFTPSERTKYVYDTLAGKIETIRDLLCDHLKPHAERFVKRAMMTFTETDKLRKCTDASFIKAVLKAAECGLAIDGKLAYAVPRWNSKIRKEEACFQPSYIGLIAVAKRVGTILTAYGDVVCENDVWEYERRFGDDHFVHRRPPLGSDRGEVVGAYQKLILPNHLTHIEVMDIHELNRIMESSESWKYADGNRKDSVWHKHTSEMQKKTVVHRALKTYQDDPGLMVAMSAVESDFERIDNDAPYQQQSGKVGRSSINDRLAAAPAAPKTAETWPAHDDDPFAGRHGDDAGEDDSRPVQQPQSATNALDAILDAMAQCKTKQELDQKYALYQTSLPEGVEAPLDVEANYQEKRDSLPDAGPAKGKQKSLMGE